MASLTDSIRASSTLKTKSLPDEASINELQATRQAELRKLLNSSANFSTGVTLTAEQVLMLNGLLPDQKDEEDPPPMSRARGKSRVRRHSLISTAAAGFDHAASLKEARLHLGTSDSIDHVLSIFHNHKQSLRSNSFSPLARFKSAAETIIKRNSAARFLAMAGANKSTRLQDSEGFQDDYDEVKSDLSSKLVFKLCSISDESKQAEMKEALKSVNEWGGFDLFGVYDLLGQNRSQTVSAVTMVVLESSRSLLQQLKIKPMTIMRYVDAVCKTYRDDISYHTALHGCDVMQGLHSLLSPRSTTGIPHQPFGSFQASKLTLTNRVIYSSLLAALVHDIGHPGKNNRYLTATSDVLAIKYNDVSVLENMHVFRALELTKLDGCDIFSTFSTASKRETRHLWISMILETDMASHGEALWLHEKNLLNSSPGNSPTEKLESYESNPANNNFSPFDSKNYIDTLALLLHSCDLGNPTKPWKTYRRWTDLVMEEFFEQSSKEQELNMPVTLPLREKCHLPNFQIGFIKYIRPFFIVLNNTPGISFEEQIQNLNDNEKKWEEQKELKLLSSEGEGKVET